MAPLLSRVVDLHVQAVLVRIPPREQVHLRFTQLVDVLGVPRRVVAKPAPRVLPPAPHLGVKWPCKSNSGSGLPGGFAILKDSAKQSF